MQRQGAGSRLNSGSRIALNQKYTMFGSSHFTITACRAVDAMEGCEALARGPMAGSSTHPMKERET
jgi:hypothetical protein